MTQEGPLTKAEQDAVFALAAEMGTRLAHGMAAMVCATNPEKDSVSVFTTWDNHFRANLKKIMAMSPEEYTRYRAHQDELGRKEAIKRELERSKRKLHDARQNLVSAKDAARKAGIL
jgi:hypothetical protein